MSKEAEAERSVIYLDGDGVRALDVHDLTPEILGQKALGLIDLPTEWVPPYFVLDGNTIPELSDVLDAAARVGIQADARVYIRSSGVDEGLESRGSLCSSHCDLAEAPREILRLREQVGRTVPGGRVHWIVQRWVKPRAKGHLSNERRLSEKARDWVAEIEPSPGAAGVTVPVAVRRWRDAAPAGGVLSCDLRANIHRTLREPAAWFGARRAHIEWVWDGERIWLVQADEAPAIAGENPRLLVSKGTAVLLTGAGLKCFRLATSEDLAKYRKLANKKLYADLGYSVPPFVVLDDLRTLEELKNGFVRPDLLEDLEILCAAPLVLRTDGTRIPHDSCQMLPRSDELRTAKSAAEWLTGKFSDDLRMLDADALGLALLGHHFLPAASSAWCLAYPDERRVRIEAMWGIPEGLYYFPHDVFDVDSGHTNPASVSLSTCRIVGRKIRHKGQFIAPDSEGNWDLHQTAVGPDWSSSVRRDEWLLEIASTSRKIAAAAVGGPVVCMWFIELPEGVSRHDVLPWYHEEWSEEQSAAFRSAPRRSHVTPNGRVLRTRKDLEMLLADTANGVHVTHVSIEPEEGDMVRERSFIERLARDAKLHGYEVQLRGGVLSHVFYALSREGCTVSCIDLFEQTDETVDYNKLVRDKIPEGILGKGESVQAIELSNEALLISLKRKLIEEGLEVFDAPDSGAIADEVADVLEVIEALLTTLGISRKEVLARKRTKKDRRGGFEKGVMLVSTQLPPPNSNSDAQYERPRIARAEDLPIQHPLTNIDRRIGPSGVAERQVTLGFPLSANVVDLKALSIDLETSEGIPHPMRLDVHVTREGADAKVRLRLVNDPLQLKLFE